MTSTSHILFWISLFMILYVYLGYAVVLGLVAFFIRTSQPELGYTPQISVLIAAYNEEANIRKKIEQTLVLDYPPDRVEIIVVSDASNDATDTIVSSFEDPRVRLIRVDKRQGKTHAQNQGVLSARGEIIVFSDATTVYHPQALRYLARNYADPRIGGASGRYHYFDSETGSPTAAGAIAFWNYENLIKSTQSRVRTISGCCGCIYSVRRKLYTALPSEVISDLVQPLHLIRQGYRVVFESRAVAYEETTHSTSAEFQMRIRVATRGIRGLLSVPDLLMPWKFPWVSLQLWSHKILRWIVPLYLLLLFASNLALVHRPVYRGFFLGQAAFYCLAFCSYLVPVHKVWKPLGIPLYFCTLNAAALFSMIEVLRGKKYVVWQTVRA
jgi:cellulose synthase/poly-beta-1,6-N-acetylglucosamine synthase-like glycosyltransferase